MYTDATLSGGVLHSCYCINHAIKMLLCVLHGVPKSLTVTIGARDQDC